MIKVTQEMVDYCKGVGEGKIKPDFQYHGLCANFGFTFEAPPFILDIVIDFSKFPDFNGGSFKHPVKGGSDAYYLAKKQGNLWDYRTTHGKSRKAFCLFCADELEKLINGECHETNI